MAIQNISGADAVPKNFAVSTSEALKQENSPLKRESIKDETVSKQIRESNNELKITNKGNNIDTTA